MKLQLAVMRNFFDSGRSAIFIAPTSNTAPEGEVAAIDKHSTPGGVKTTERSRRDSPEDIESSPLRKHHVIESI